MAMFKRGEMVECLKALESVTDELTPVVGGIYTVRSVASFGGGMFGIRLQEIRNVPRRYFDGTYECYFRTAAFRKVKKPDISALRELVANPNTKVPA